MLGPGRAKAGFGGLAGCDSIIVAFEIMTYALCLPCAVHGSHLLCNNLVAVNP
jgi:hypothetical protein